MLCRIIGIRLLLEIGQRVRGSAVVEMFYSGGKFSFDGGAR